ncbi:MAG: hypothetical protein KDC57_19250, partial [Saprospiraceae bacterium]|nr:hypothetical protein [Saprospiraceae bacterium]
MSYCTTADSIEKQFIYYMDSLLSPNNHCQYIRLAGVDISVLSGETVNTSFNVHVDDYPGGEGQIPLPSTCGGTVRYTFFLTGTCQNSDCDDVVSVNQAVLILRVIPLPTPEVPSNDTVYTCQDNITNTFQTWLDEFTDGSNDLFNYATCDVRRGPLCNLKTRVQVFFADDPSRGWNQFCPINENIVACMSRTLISQLRPSDTICGNRITIRITNNDEIYQSCGDSVREATFTIIDRCPPTITCLTQFIEIDPNNNCEYVIGDYASDPWVSTTDDCNSMIVGMDVVLSQIPAPNTETFTSSGYLTFVATDAAGNSSACRVVVTDAKIGVAKKLDTVYQRRTTDGLIEACFSVKVQNLGLDTLYPVDLYDTLYFHAEVTGGSLTYDGAAVDPVFGYRYSGDTTFVSAEGAKLAPGEYYIISYCVIAPAAHFKNADGSVLCNSAVVHADNLVRDTMGLLVSTTSVMDRSENGDQIELDIFCNASNDDCTTVYVPGIGLAKNLDSVVQVPNEPGIFQVYTSLVIKSIGNDPLQNITLTDHLPAQGFIEVDTVLLVDHPATTSLDSYFYPNNEGFIIFSGILQTGDSMIVQIVSQYRAYEALDVSEMIICNTAYATGVGVSSIVSAIDTSQAGTLIDPDFDWDPANNNECTLLPIPSISVVKDYVIDSVFCDPILGELFAITFQYAVVNTGNVSLDSICLTDDLGGQLGQVLIDQQASVYGTAANCSDLAFSPTSDTIFWYTCTSFLPNDSIWASKSVVVDPNGSGAPSPLMNQARVVAWDTLGKQFIADLSDAGDQPKSNNPAHFADQGTDNDATQIRLPLLGVAKWVDSVRLVMTPDSVGNFEVTYKIKVKNIGNTPLDSILLVEDLDGQLGPAYMIPPDPMVTVTNGTGNASFNGTTNDTLLSPAVNKLGVDDSIVVCLKIMVNPNAMGASDTLLNQAYAWGVDTSSGYTTEDYSDAGTDAEGTNGIGECDDPTLVQLKDINVSKQILSVTTYRQDSLPGVAAVEFQVLIKNKGNVPFYDLMLVDSIADQLGTALVAVLEPPSIHEPPRLINGVVTNLNGTSYLPTIQDFPKILDGTVVLDTLERDSFIDVRFTLLIDPNAVGAPSPLKNQAAVMGNTIIGDHTDRSDTGPDPESSNGGEEGDSGGEHDPTCVNVPMVNLNKNLDHVEDSPAPGNFRAVYHLIITNTGNTPLDSLSLTDDIMTQFGIYFQNVVSVLVLSSDATAGVEVNPGYDGTAGSTMIIPSDATYFEPGQQIIIELKVEVDPVIGNSVADTLYNQAEVWARGVSPTGMEINGNDGLVDAYGRVIWTHDLSDPGVDPDGLNPGAPGDQGTGNDPTFIPPCWFNCDGACADLVNVSLGSDCQIFLTGGVLIQGKDPYCVQLGFYAVTSIKDRYGNPVPNPVTSDYRGQELYVTVENIVCENKCWGIVKVEDKMPPQIVCTNDTISCLQMSEREDLIVLSDNCMEYPPKLEVLEKQWKNLGCEDRNFIGYLARKVRATDVWGNYNECRDTLFVRKETIDSLVCGPDTLIECTTDVLRNGKIVELLWNAGKDGDTYLDDQGYAHPWPTKGDGYFPAPYLKSTQPGQDPGYLLPLHTDVGPDFANSGKCQIVFDYEDHIIPTCGRSYKIRRTWHIYDWCGGRDTMCVQWFKITDTEAPVIAGAYLSSLDDNPSGTDCDVVPESVFRKAIDLGAWLACKVLNGEVAPHDCKATVILPDPRAWVLKDCDDQLEVHYEIEYSDPSHPGKTLLESGNIAEGETAHVYLPAGWHNVLYHIRDRCWNETLLLQGISVYDNTPPTPVCDEITQVSLDPEKCWARIYAKDLDDGSHDNCCDQLHFAVANMDSVSYWRGYWQDYFASCYDHYTYLDNKVAIDEAIEEWINIFVFNDYIDVTECGSEQLVLRVYEACDVPVYDSHTFFSGEHKWYWWNKSPLFMAWYLWRLDDYIHYGDPRPNFTCTSNEPFAVVPFSWDIPVTTIGIVGQRICNNPIVTPTGYIASCISSPANTSRSLFSLVFDLQKNLQAVPWQMLAWQILTEEAAKDWKERVFDPYRAETQITASLNLNKPYYSSELSSDCMIEVLKDDKVPPVVVAPEDITAYCDGVPYWWELTKTYAGGTKSISVNGHGAQFTHDVCDGEDVLQTYCSSPYFGGGSDVALDPVSGFACCVEIPWDGGDYGYYGGPVCGESTYAGGVNCDEYSYWYKDHNWQPIYCRLWLMLDKYDNPDGGHPNPQRYFDETAEDWVITDNCWAPDTDVEYSGSLNECGVGTLTKTVTATDKCGNTSHDTQTLYVKPRSDFEVIFPEDVVVNCTDQANLAADRSGAGYPEISDDDCELIGVTYSDERYDVTEGCYKILRTWKLIDWCVYSPDIHHRYPDVIVDDRLVASEARCCIHRNLKDDGDGYMTYLQVIKVVDDEAPVIVCNDLDET